MEQLKMKICKKCNVLKPRSEFYHQSDTIDGLRGWCKTCESIRSKEWRNKNDYLCRLRRREWYYKYRDRENKKSLARRNANKDKFIEAARQWRKENPDRVKANKLKWNREHPDKCLEMKRRKNSKILSTPNGRLNHYFSGYIRMSLNGKKNGRKWESLVGYTLKDLIAHLEKKFQPGMTWNNYGKWHVDHVFPLSRLYFDSVEDPTFKFAWSLNNLQPLWKEDNIRKGNNILQCLAS